MSFRKRNIGLSSGVARDPSTNASGAQHVRQAPMPGLRPSPIDGRQTMSTGTATLDNLLAGHAGLALGSSLLVEESGTTDFAGALVRYYAAEGVVQEHRVHVVGFDRQWAATLPGLIGTAEASESSSARTKEDKMKIAWRYERLGGFGLGIASSRVPVADSAPDSQQASKSNAPAVFCHAFDLTKRLTHPSIESMNFIPLPKPSSSQDSPYSSVAKQLSDAIESSPPNTVHRLIIPSLLSPALYTPQASQPEHVLQFMHNLRALLSTYSDQLTAMVTLPISLYPRSSGLVRWIELLSDGVIELAPFPHTLDANSLASSGAATNQEEPPQGMLKLHRLPVLHERGGGMDKNVGEDWAFTLSRRKFAIKPFSLPPIDGDNGAQQHDTTSGPKKADLEF
ncbi:Elongator subunit elp4 [Microsporum audouinii]